MLRKGIPNEVYHAEPALNRSVADKMITTCPLKVKYEMEKPSPSSPALLNGGHIHSGVLEPHLTDSEYGCKPLEIDGNSSRTNAYKELFAEMQDANPSKRWITESDYNNNKEVIASVLEHPLAHEIHSNPKGMIEHTGFYDLVGTACKVRPDYYEKNGRVVDLKTTTDASEKGFLKSIRQFNYIFQAAWYFTGLRAMGEEPKQFVFLVVEKSPPYATRCYALDNSDIEREIPRVFKACKLWDECLKTDIWPGYGDDIKTIQLSLNTNSRLSISDIAKKFKVGRSFVYKIIKKHQVETRSLGNRKTIDMVDFARAIRWENEGKKL